MGDIFLQLFTYICVFPKLGVPPNHPLKNRVFHEINYPFWGTPVFGNIHLVDDQIIATSDEFFTPNGGEK